MSIPITDTIGPVPFGSAKHLERCRQTNHLIQHIRVRLAHAEEIAIELEDMMLLAADYWLSELGVF